MNKILLTFVVLYIITLKGNCQNINLDFDCLNGLWENIFINHTGSKPTIEKNIREFCYYNGTKQISIVDDLKNITIKYYFNGYLDSLDKNSNTMIDVRFLKQFGEIFISGLYPQKGYLADKYTLNKIQIYCDNNTIEQGNSTSKKAFFLTSRIFDFISNLKLENLDFKEFNAEKYSPYRIIKTKKVFINSEPLKSTKMYLLKGDKVVVEEEDLGWVKIIYYGKKKVSGWVKLEDIE